MQARTNYGTQIVNSTTSNVKYAQDNCGMIRKEKFKLSEELHILVRQLNNIDNEPGDCIFGVCKSFIRKLMDDFFTIIDDKKSPI